MTQAVSPDPISFDPSASWDGNDGPWSSFTIQVGSPPQSLRLFPSTSTSAILAMIPQTCNARIPGTCDKARGSFFNISASSTWENIGAYTIANYAGGFLGYGGGATYGLENVTLDWPGSGGVKLSGQVVGGSGSADYYTGIFGMSPEPNNFTDVNNRKPSLLRSMRNNNLIPSVSYAYTAGAYYRERKPFGSLSFGGYDSSRLIPHNVSFPFSTDISRRLLINVQSITVGLQPLLTKPFYAFIDSTDPNIWLPLELCQKFEETFNLTWNEQLEMYFFQESANITAKRQHEGNDPIIFTLAENSTSGSKVALEFPFEAFQQLASPPITRNGTIQQYFPLKRGTNETQYVLGRAFLQETYLVVDHDRANFSVYQAAFPSTNTQKNIVAILAPTENSDNSGHGFSKGKIAGIAIAGVGVLVIVILGIYLWLRKRKRVRRSVPIEDFGKPELDGTEKRVDTKEDEAIEADGQELKNAIEVATSEDRVQAIEMPERREQRVGLSELEAEIGIPEMEAQNRGPIYELGGEGRRT